MNAPQYESRFHCGVPVNVMASNPTPGYWHTIHGPEGKSREEARYCQENVRNISWSLEITDVSREDPMQGSESRIQALKCGQESLNAQKHTRKKPLMVDPHVLLP